MGAALLRGLRHRVVTALDDARSCKDVNPAAAIMLLCAELKELSDLYLTTAGAWSVAAPYIERTISRTNPGLASQFSIVSAETMSIAERIRAFEQILETVLQPYGGPLRYFETAPVPPASS